MLAKLRVKNPTLKIDFDGGYELVFPLYQEDKVKARNLFNAMKLNKKELEIKIDYFKKARSIKQNALMWDLLDEFAKFLNAGRTGGITPETLYARALKKYGVAEFAFIKEAALEDFKEAFKDVLVIDKEIIKGEPYFHCKCYLGSSTYNTVQMKNLIDGILDEMAMAGCETPEKIDLEREWKSHIEKLP